MRHIETTGTVNVRGEEIALLDRAINFATEAHRTQKRRSGAPYIEHPLYVMNLVRDDKNGCIGAQIVAVLHDVLEDTNVSLEKVLKEFGPTTARAVDLLTKQGLDPNILPESINVAKNLVYEKMLQRIIEAAASDDADKARAGQIAALVKRADIEHNLADNPKPESRERYEQALTKLGGVATSLAEFTV